MLGNVFSRFRSEAEYRQFSLGVAHSIDIVLAHKYVPVRSNYDGSERVMAMRYRLACDLSGSTEEGNHFVTIHIWNYPSTNGLPQANV